MGPTSYHTTRQAIDGFGYKIGPGNKPVLVDVPPGSNLDGKVMLTILISMMTDEATALDCYGMEPGLPRGRQ